MFSDSQVWLGLSSMAWVLLLLVAVALFFARDLRDLWLLHAYSQVFKPGKIAQNFRSLHEKYATVPLRAAQEPVRLPVAPLPDPLPLQFEFEGQSFSVTEQIEQRQLTSMVILHRGQIVHEAYFQGNTAEKPVIVFSVTKSLMGLLTGIAVDQGFVHGLSDPVDRYAPELKGTPYEGVTVQNVLDMCSGVRWREAYTDRDAEIVQSLLASLTGSLNAYTRRMQRERPQGVFNQYTSMDTQVLGMVVAGATGQPLQHYFASQLWDRIYPEHPGYFMTDQTGFVLAYGGLMVTPRDLAKVGLLMLRGGRNERGEAVLSPAWISASTTPDRPQLMPGKRANSDAAEGYKNQWWFPVGRRGGEFSAIGIYGQTLYVNPELDVVIASNSAYADYPHDLVGDSRRLAMMGAIARHVAAQSLSATPKGGASVVSACG